MYSKMIKLLFAACVSILPHTKLFAADYEYSTIAGLKAASIPADNATAYVKGYYAVNDNGGGTFIWDNASTATDNGGTIIIPNSLPTTGRWIRDYDKSEINVNWFGAKGDNSTDDTNAIQHALDLAGNLGGTVVKLLPLRYKITDSLMLYDGVRLLGSGDSYYGTGGSSGKGTVLYNAGSCAAIKVIGLVGYGFEIGNMHILGNSSTDSGIYLTYQTGNSRVPRCGYIHNISIKNTGDCGIKLDCFSYCLFEQVSLVPAAGYGIHITDAGSLYREFAWFEKVCINGNTDTGVQIDAGNNIYFNYLDVNDCNTGIYVHGHSYNIFFHCTNLVRMSSTNIELYADTCSVARIFFDKTTILMKGEQASEMALYAHRESNYVVDNTDFHYLDINKVGAVAPTYAIYGDSGFTRSSFSRLRNCSSGLFSPNVYADIRVDFEGIKLKNRVYASGDGSTVTFPFTLSSASPYHTAPVINVNTNQTIPYSIDVSNTQGGMLSLSITFATAPVVGSNNITVSYQIAR